MKLPKITNKWLWIAFTSFILMLAVTLIEVHTYYPQVKSYFDNSRSLSAQNLAARSRNYLLVTIDTLNTKTYTPQIKEQIEEKLDLAYSFLNIELYTKSYTCTISALQGIDELYTQLQYPQGPILQQYLSTALPIIDCTENIQVGSDQIRAHLGTTMLEDITFQLRLMIFGTGLFFVLCLLFLAIHKKQRRLIHQNIGETHRWIKNAMEDALTGAQNRRALDTALSKFAKGNRLYAILMCDIDHFKKYNDRYGHLEGDKVLRCIADTIKSTLREQDTLYRYGGEELVVILDKTNKKSAVQIAQRIKETIQDLSLPHPDSGHKIVTVSIGCASNSEIKDNTKNLVKLADEHLYAAKRGGRNCIAY